jgi:phytol kinase
VSGAAGIALLAGLLAGLMLAVRAAQRRGAVGPELARKLVHMGMGAVCLAFPWIFSSAGPVWLLAAITSAGLLAVRWVPALGAAVGGVLGGVRRTSWGEVYFPGAVAAVFALAQGNRAEFCAPVAMLAFGDAAGALVGQRWGRIKFRTVESLKSVEGSAAVGAVSAAAVVIALRVQGGMGWPEALFTGAILGVFAAMVEAVSWRGLDNLLVPLVAWAQLRVYAGLPGSELALRGAVLALVAGLMFAWRARLLDFGARLGAALVLYFSWALGGWHWLAAPVTLLASYAWITPRPPAGEGRYHLAAVVCIGSAGVGWAVANARSAEVRWLWLFTLGLATQQAIIAAVRWSQAKPQWGRARWWTMGFAQATVVQGGVFVAVNGAAAIAPHALVTGAVVMAAALAVFIAGERDLALPDDMNARWWRQGAAAVLASLAAFATMLP